MRVNVLLFANCADIVGERRIEVDAAEGSTVGRLLEQLVLDYPGLARMSEIASVAVNAEYTDSDRQLVHGDEVAIIPPVSGG